MEVKVFTEVSLNLPAVNAEVGECPYLAILSQLVVLSSAKWVHR